MSHQPSFRVGTLLCLHGTDHLRLLLCYDEHGEAFALSERGNVVCLAHNVYELLREPDEQMSHGS